MIFGLILLAIIICVVISCVKVVRQAQALVIERLGAYQATWGTGLHFKIPIFDRVARRVDLKEQVVDFAPQPVITKDNVTMRIDTVVFYQITDPKMFCYGVANPIMAIENLTATTLRNIIGDLELDQTLTSRETINTKMRGYYRQCFYNRELDYKKYDEMFYHTIAEDTEETAAELALNRLRFPVELSEKNKNVYEAYIQEHMETVAVYLVKREDIEGIRFLEQKKLWSEAALQTGMDVAAEEKKTESLSVLMDVRKELFPKKKKTFEL